MARIQSFESVQRLVVDKYLSPEAQGRMVANAARRIIDETTAHNAQVLGKAPAHMTYVDGRASAPLESVHLPSGTILVEYQLVSEVVAWVRDQLVKHAPVLTGSFRRSFLLFADGQEISPDGPIPAAKELEFISDAPYARKLEGVSGRKPTSAQAPDGVFQVVAGLAHARFGNIAKCGFALRSLPSGAVGAWARTRSARDLARNRRGGNPRLHTEWLTRQPTIWIQPR